MVKLQYADGCHRAFGGDTGVDPLRSRAEAYSYSSTMCGSKDHRFLAWILT